LPFIYYVKTIPPEEGCCHGKLAAYPNGIHSPPKRQISHVDGMETGFAFP
jgi:hypothetical protein